LSREPPGGRDPGPGIAFALAAVVVLGLRPYMFAVTSWPASRDAALWILRGMPANPEWASWVFGSKHFVGYRPLAALTYTLDSLVAGFAPWAYRLTDLVAHVLCILLVYALYRRLAPELPRWGGVVASGLFAAHPVVSEVVPHLARRSYSMATMFSLAALCVAAGACGKFLSPLSRTSLAGLLLLAGLLSNEIAYMTLPMLLLVAWQDGRRTGQAPGSIAVACSGPLAAFAAALALRLTVVGGIGGYAAGVERGERLLPIIAATWRTLVPLTSLEAPARTPSAFVVTAFVAIGAYYVWRAIRMGTGRGTGILLLAWLAGYTLMFAPLGVWFPRQMYPLAAPFALLVAVVLAERPRPSAHLLPQAVLILWALAHSPIVLGSDPLRAAALTKTDTMLRDAARDLGALEDVPVVRLALPHYRRPEVVALRARPLGSRPPLAADLPKLWLDALLADRAFELETFLIYERDPLTPAAAPGVGEHDGRTAIALKSDGRFWIFDPDAESIRAGQEALVVLPQSAPLYFHDGDEGRLVD